ncbi:MAG: DNA polymerase III subunit alpha [Prevotellaceae bacterium]|jgi:DNA polymerase-3 subunit alpha|nr:DNA polymerase III subunit alpha [Prevotellaceae bacterium]
MFTHLHVHTKYSISDGIAEIEDFFTAAKADGQKALAITDFGNMYGVARFVKAARCADIKPIIGCEVYVANSGNIDNSPDASEDESCLVLLAKNKTGYLNLMQLVSLSFVDDFSIHPHTDREMLFRYAEGLIVLSSSCFSGEIPKLIRAGNIAEAERVALEFKEHFGEDFYLEIQRHKCNEIYTSHIFTEQTVVIEGIMSLSAKFGIKTVATNNVYFVRKTDAIVHDKLICMSAGAIQIDPRRLRYTGQEWLKTRSEMQELFADIPEAVANTKEIADKVETYSMQNETAAPLIVLPKEFKNVDDCLKHFTLEGAKKRYGEISRELSKRIETELDTIGKAGYAEHFLAVSDFAAETGRAGIIIRSGYGGIIGSAVAYCLGITHIDPVKYRLLFECFINPDNAPTFLEFHFCFDSDGSIAAAKHIRQKYGDLKVAHGIKFELMNGRHTIREVGRIFGLSISRAGRIAKLVPEADMKLDTALKKVPILKKELRSDNNSIKNTLKYAQMLEGSIQNAAIHPNEMIVGGDDLKLRIPLCMLRQGLDDEKYIVSQYESADIEDTELLRINLFGLKSLDVIHELLENIKKQRNIDLNPDEIPLDDKETFEMFTCGETEGTEIFELEVMRKWMKNLKPDRFEELVAINALYRPGTSSLIPYFIARKHGRSPITYEIDEQSEFLDETYGITVYHEQVMLMAQSLADFSAGEADLLRTALIQKSKNELGEMKKKFIEGGKSKGYGVSKLRKIWTEWEDASPFLRSKANMIFSTCILYRIAYLKTHYPEIKQ